MEMTIDKELKKKARKNKTKIKRTKSEKVLFGIVFALFTIYAISIFYPLVWGLLSSLKMTNEYYENLFGLPTNPQFGNYIRAFGEITLEGQTSFIEMIWNSIWFSLGSALIHMETLSAVAYCLCKYKFPGRNFWWGFNIFMITVPLGASFVSTYKLYYSLHITNSYFILITAFVCWGMQLIMFNSFYAGVSNSYMEAAEIDGAGFFQIYLKAMRPQATPMLITMLLMEFMGKWNDYMSPLLFLPKMPTLATGLFQFQSIVERTGDYPILFSGLMMCAFPIFVLFFIFSDKLMANISIGGLKG